MAMTTERRCACCETWTREYLAVCSDCHGERTEAICRLKTEREAGRREALEEVRAAINAFLDDPDSDTMPGAEIAAVYEILRNDVPHDTPCFGWVDCARQGDPSARACLACIDRHAEVQTQKSPHQPEG